MRQIRLPHPPNESRLGLGANVYEISVVSYQGNPPQHPIAVVFGRDGGTIGRGPGNTLVLPDPNRFVSRVQAKVACNGEQMTIANASTANPLLVNDRELEAGATATLAEGDELRVGLFLLRVRRIAPASRESDRSAQQPRAVPRPAPARTAPDLPRDLPPGSASAHVGAGSLGPVDPLQLQFGGTDADPFADLMPKKSAAAPAADVPPARLDRSSSLAGRTPLASGVRIEAQRAAPPAGDANALRREDRSTSDRSSTTTGHAPRIPESVWDDLAKLSPHENSSPQPPAALPADFDAFAEASGTSRNAEDPLAEFAQSGIALDALDGLEMPVDGLFVDTPSGAALSDPIVPDPHEPQPDPLAGPDSADPLAIFGDNESGLRIPADPGFSRSEADDVPELDAYFRPPAARFEQPAPVRGSDDPLGQNPTLLVVAPRTAIPSGARAARMFDAPAVAAPQDSVQSDAIPGKKEFPEQGVFRDTPLPSSPAQTQPPFDDRLLQALLAGAGIPNASIKEGLSPELMKRIGAMLAAAVQGTIELIATRALLKREVKADVTIIASTRNNPLKFLPDAESALLQMFGSRIPGFMAPVEAMEDAFRDLRAHEVGVIAGMHAALAEVLARFEPSALERRLKPAGVLEGLLPNSHEARLWKTFEEMYVDISREAQDDFQSLFGKAFVHAYENEISRLKGK